MWRSLLLGLCLCAGAAEGAGIRYQVRPGETLFRIAQRTGLSERQIQQANPVMRGRVTLYAGQIITIPPRPVPPGSFSVRQGESLRDIARRLGVGEAEIRRANPSINRRGSLNAGQVLRLPAKVIAAQRAAEKRKLAQQQKAAALAQRQAAQKQAAQKRQNQKRQQQLAQKAPKPRPKPTTHRVQRGETFFSIARKYQLNPLELQRLNARLARGTLNVGAVLRLVAPRPVAAAPRPKPKAASLRRPSILVRAARSQPQVWIWPVPGYGRVTSDFGPRVLNGSSETHTGIDVGAPSGTPVVAARSGRVVEARYDTTYGWGRTVVIQHPDGWKTRYAHLSSMAVRSGQLIRQGERVGSVGSTGRVTGPHLHFGLYRESTVLNPLALFGGNND